MVLRSGENTILSMKFMMRGDMGGMHDFRVHILSNDPTNTDLVSPILSNWIQ